MAQEKLNLAILISGRGSNMDALIHACAQPGFPAFVSVVVSNRPDAPGLKKAAGKGIATVVVDHKKYPDRSTFDKELQKTLELYPVDLICLAGFMRILGADFIRPWEGRIINIHPSLLPEYKGLQTHERVIADGKKESGCTVHHVIPAMDEGPVIVQKKVPVLAGDTPETLAVRILEKEHEAYPEAVRILAGKLKNSPKVGIA